MKISPAGEVAPLVASEILSLTKHSLSSDFSVPIELQRRIDLEEVHNIPHEHEIQKNCVTLLYNVDLADI